MRQFCGGKPCFVADFRQMRHKKVVIECLLSRITNPHPMADGSDTLSLMARGLSMIPEQPGLIKHLACAVTNTF